MAKCKTCRKNDVMDTWHDKFCEWAIFKLFPKTLVDFHQDKYTQGFGDGYAMGMKHANQNIKLYEDIFK